MWKHSQLVWCASMAIHINFIGSKDNQLSAFLHGLISLIELPKCLQCLPNVLITPNYSFRRMPCLKLKWGLKRLTKLYKIESDIPKWSKTHYCLKLLWKWKLLSVYWVYCVFSGLSEMSDLSVRCSKCGHVIPRRPCMQRDCPYQASKRHIPRSPEPNMIKYDLIWSIYIYIIL